MAMAMWRLITSADRPSTGGQRLGYGDAGRLSETPAVKCRKSLVALLIAGAAVGGVTLTLAPRAHAMPAPEVEYTFDVVVRKHYDFPNNDAIGYGYGICDKVSRGESYPQVMGDVKREITPNDEFSANYLVSYAVNLLCPEQIWQLRNSAGGYRPPGGATGPATYY
ncbi:DUF732 domain-containing protein [Mycobacterium paraseoulense]|uniref:DUF732 domain-containing protein n=1 Tax=Mycobacterium TaxID=1763 RepID=UPI00138D3B22|nr:DUF732 domain-containing protein [Mycobacterium paraseoulense]BBZ70305.1 hypothetical protein MPRS_13980 [Mycobacterium paraseoulense]